MLVGNGAVTFQNACMMLKCVILGPDLFNPNKWFILLLKTVCFAYCNTVKRKLFIGFFPFLFFILFSYFFIPIRKKSVLYVLDFVFIKVLTC